METNIENFIKKARNKLIVINKKESDIITSVSFNNLGILLSEELNKIKTASNFSLRAKFLIENILDSIVIKNKNFGDIVALKNIGILFEPELKVDVLQLLDKHSRTYPLFMQWEGEIENNCLYFLTKVKGIEINIKNLSHIII